MWGDREEDVTFAEVANIAEMLLKYIDLGDQYSLATNIQTRNTCLLPS